jgi:hypothetical protein
LLLVATNLKQWNMQQLPTFRDIYRISRSAAAPWTTNRPAQRAGRRSTTEYHLTRKEDFFLKKHHFQNKCRCQIFSRVYLRHRFIRRLIPTAIGNATGANRRLKRRLSRHLFLQNDKKIYNFRKN